MPPAMRYPEPMESWPMGMSPFGYAPMVWGAPPMAGMSPMNMMGGMMSPNGMDGARLLEDLMPNMDDDDDYLKGKNGTPPTASDASSRGGSRKGSQVYKQAPVAELLARQKYYLREGLRTPSSLGSPPISNTPTEAPSPRGAPGSSGSDHASSDDNLLTRANLEGLSYPILPKDQAVFVPEGMVFLPEQDFLQLELQDAP